ncbi:MAG: DNA repair protein RecO [Brevinema sp.]
MTRHCEGLILSKKGFGSGHLILNFLDSELGKVKIMAYGAALETGARRAMIQSGSFIEGLISKKKDALQLTDSKLLLSSSQARDDLRYMGFMFFTLEMIDHFLLEGDLFPYYEDLKEAFELFYESLDEKYLLFFLGKFLSCESWLEIAEKDKLQAQTLRFLSDSREHPMNFLQGKNISMPRKKELSYFYAYALQDARGKMPHSLELLRFDIL